MIYMLDTNMCVYIIKQQPAHVINKFTSLNPEAVSVSSITVAELQYGVAKSLHKIKNSDALQEFLSPLNIEMFDETCAEIYGELRATLEKSGQSIGSMDTLIAAHALSIGAILVTNNLSAFKRVKGLKLDNWA